MPLTMRQGGFTMKNSKKKKAQKPDTFRLSPIVVEILLILFGILADKLIDYLIQIIFK